MSRSFKRVLNWAGSLLAIIGVVFVIVRLSRYGAQIDFSRFSGATWLIVAGFAGIYGGSNLLLALGWRNLLRYLHVQASWRWVMSIYGTSQLAKYVPGNVFQFAGRQAMGMASGVPGGALAKSAVWELALLCIAGAMYGLLVLPLIFLALPLWIGYATFLLAIGVAVGALRAWMGQPVMWAFVGYLGFLAISGGLFAGLVCLLTQSPIATASTSFWISLSGSFVIAWLVGLITPGAPAGVGIRELVLLFLLKGVVLETDLVLAVALGRVVTVIGDLIYFFFAVMSSCQDRIEG